MISFLLVTGPPFDAPLWSSVASRIRDKNHSVSTFSMLQAGDGSLDNESALLAQKIFEERSPVVLIAHGTAIPAAIDACQKVSPAALILSNGPLRDEDFFTRGLIHWANLPALFTEKILSPNRMLNVMASSIGFRRLVVNPYVMDHDTTVTVCGPIFQTQERRHRMRSYLRSLAKFDWKTPLPNTPTILLWGNSDNLTTSKIKTFLDSTPSTFEYEAIPGGRYLHPIERPWELADRSIRWAEKTLTTT